jgi:hypothetical protein
MKQAYLIKVVIPSISRSGTIVHDPQVRDQRLREISLDLFNRFNERVHILKRVGAVAITLTETQAASLTWHPSIETIRPIGDHNARTNS